MKNWKWVGTLSLLFLSFQGATALEANTGETSPEKSTTVVATQETQGAPKEDSEKPKEENQENQKEEGKDDSSKEPIKPGWQQKEDHWYYQNPDGTYATGFQFISHVTYHFSKTGEMSVGWKKIDGKWYHFNDRGYLKTGWLKDQNKWYFLKEDGTMRIGWEKIHGVWYFFRDSGAMATGWVLTGNLWYYMQPNGALSVGWKKINQVWYYFDANGSMHIGWKKIGNTWYYLKSNGAMSTGWLKIGYDWYYLKNNGSMVSGNYKINGTLYHFLPSGRWIVNKVYLGIKTVNQYKEKVYQGCEPAALWGILKHQGKTNKTYKEFLKEMPIAKNGNPYEGFGGNPYLPDGDANQWGFAAIYPKPLTTWAKKYGEAKDISGASVATLKEYLKKEIPVVTWVTVHYLSPWWTTKWFGKTLNNNHAVILDGFDEKNKRLHVSDSIDGAFWISEKQFSIAYSPRKFAVAIPQYN